MREHATAIAGKTAAADHAGPTATAGKRSLVEVSQLAPERADFRWEDISDAAFQADAHRAELGEQATEHALAQHGDRGEAGGAVGAHEGAHHDHEARPAQHEEQHAGVGAEDGELDALPPVPAADTGDSHSPAAIARAQQLDPEAGVRDANAPTPHADAHKAKPKAKAAAKPKAPTVTKRDRLKVADPFILADGPIWYAYGTGLSVRSSRDLGKTWTDRGRMMKFAKGGRRWAPEVHKIGAKYVTYMSVSKTKTSRIKIYVATSDHPVHGWSTPHPIAAAKKWNNIDATFVHDEKSHKNYLVWKEDRKSKLGRKTIVMQELNDKGTRLAKGSHKRTLLTAGKGEHSGLERRPAPRAPNWSVEAPTIEPHGGKYWLFYSGAGYERGGGYFVGVASAKKITGPYKREPKPLLRGHGSLHEPGHQSVIKVEINGKIQWLMFFHSRHAHGDARYLREDQIVWVHGKPHVKPV